MGTEAPAKKTRPKHWVFRKECGKKAVIYAIETPPGKYPFAFKDTQENDGWEFNEDDEDEGYTVRHLNVFIPRLLWIISVLNGGLHKVRVFWITAPFKKEKLRTRLYMPPLPNVDEEGSMCYGNFKTPRRNEVDIVNDFMEHAFNSVWTSDIDCFYDVLTAHGINGAREWHDRSRKRTSNPFKTPDSPPHDDVRGVISIQADALGFS